jgi:hypothetical protein
MGSNGNGGTHLVSLHSTCVASGMIFPFQNIIQYFLKKFTATSWLMSARISRSSAVMVSLQRSN